MESTEPNGEQVLLPRTSGGQDVFQRVLAGFDLPAYMKRARRVEQVWADLVAGLRHQRDKDLEPVRAALEALLRLAGAVAPAAGMLAEPALLAALVDETRPALPAPRSPAAAWRLRWALDDLIVAVERFNADWEARLRRTDLSAVAAERDGYNRYYLLEKECVVRNAVVARVGFTPLPMPTADELRQALPPLPVPRLK